MIAENTTPEPETPGGLGGCAPWPVEDNRLIGWAVKGRWPEKDGINKAVDVTLKNMDDTDPRVANVAVRNFISMVAQNQKDEERANPAPLVIDVRHGDERAAFAGFLRDIAIRRDYSGLDGAGPQALGGPSLPAHPNG